MSKYKCNIHKSNEGFINEEGKWVCWYCYIPIFDCLVVKGSKLWLKLLFTSARVRQFRGLKRLNPIKFSKGNSSIFIYLVEIPRSSRKFAIQVVKRNVVESIYYFDKDKELAVDFFNNFSEANLVGI